MPETIRIFIGCAANHEDLESQLVLQHTIEKFASQPVDLTWMQLSRNPSSPYYSAPEKNEGWRTEKWATPFSGFRWAIPAICNWEGKAIYFDSDFIVRADVAELWNQTFRPERVVIAKGDGRFCCSMWDCAAAKLHVPSLITLQRDPDSHAKMARYFTQHSRLMQPFANGNWNTLDIGLPPDLARPDIKAIHYTRMEQQLQLKHAVPRLKLEGRKHWYNRAIKPHDRPDLQEIFDKYYEEAVAAGHSIDEYRVPLYGEYRIRGAG